MPDTAAPRAHKDGAAHWARNYWLVVLVGVGYGLAQSALRLAISSNLPQDDVTSNIFAQTFALGYTERQPPLHEWLVWGLQLLTGPTLPSFLIIKYGLLAATLGFLYLAAKRLFDDPKWAALAALSLLLTYQIGWNLHEGVTQTMLLMGAVAGSIWAFMRLVERGGFADYLLFGVFLGLGMLSKYSFAAFVLALAAGAMLQAPLRARILTWPMLVSAAVAALITAPMLYWLVAGQHDLVGLYGKAVAPHAEGRLKATLIGLGLAVFSPLAFLFPLDAILPLIFPRMLRQAAIAVKQAVTWDAGAKREPDWEMLLLHMTLASFLILILGAVLTGANHYLERYMHPFFLLTPLWLMAMAKRSEPRPRQVTALIAVLAVALAAGFFVRAYDLAHAMGPSCNECRVAIPYDGLAAALRERGFQSGTIIAGNRPDAGNLRRLFPAARVVCLRWPAYGPPIRASDLAAKAVLVWTPKRNRKKGDALPKGAEEEIAKLAGSPHAAPERLRIPWQPFGSPSPSRSWEWMVQVIDVPGRPAADGAGQAPPPPANASKSD